MRAILLTAALPACLIASPAIVSAADQPGMGLDVGVTAPMVATTPAPDAGVAPPTQVLVRFRSDTDPGERRAAREGADADFVEPLPLPGLQLVDPEPGTAVRETVAELERSPDVLYAEPDAIRTTMATASDTFFDLLWGLDNTGQDILGTEGEPDADIDAPEAWDVETGDAAVRIGVLDSGVAASHPDLAPNISIDPGEVPGNGVDDDNNGYKDDVSGWDWVGKVDDTSRNNDPADEDNDPADLHGHGTHVAGTIGGRGNDSFGVTGVAWEAGIVPLRVLGTGGSGPVSDIVKGYAYAADNDIPIVNASLGGPIASDSERDALAAAPDVLFVVAAGNEANDNDTDDPADPNDPNGSYPCNWDLDNVICVAATDQSDRLAAFSNYGATTVDLAAPGTNIASTYFDHNDDCQPDWAYLGGTSMATPHVAGVAALIRSLRPNSTVAQVKADLLSSVDVKTSLAGRVVTGGRLNAYEALGGDTAPRMASPTATGPPPGMACPRSESEPVPAAQPMQTPVLTQTPSPAPAPATAPSEPAEAATHRPGSLRVRSGRVVRGRGTVARLFKNDGRRLELAARRSRRTFVAELTTSAKLTAAQRAGLNRLELAYDGGASPGGATVLVRVYDWTTRRWRTVATLRNATRDRTVRWSVTRGAARYVSSDGVVRMSIRGTATKAFRTRSDLLRLTTR